MVHTLKRVYLYTAVTFALLFTAGFTINLLVTLFHAAGLLQHYTYYDGTGIVTQTASPPSGQAITESIVFFVIALVLVGLAFGGSHYWLIRRDARDDPQANAGATRHIFLNGLMALSTLIAVPAGLIALSEIDQLNSSSDVATPLSFALVFAGVFALVALERARVKLAGRAAALLRQIHEVALQGILLVFVSVMLYGALAALIRWPLWANNLAAGNCNGVVYGPASTFSIPCPLPILGPVLQAVFALAAWWLYVWLGRGYWGAVLQRVLWYAALGLGIILFLAGVQQGVNLGLSALFGVENAWQEALEGGLAFISLLLTGILIALPYVFWLRRLAVQRPALRPAIPQGMLAILTAISAGFFLTGAAMVLDGLVEQVVPGGKPLRPDEWATAVSLFITGLGYVPLWLRLRRRSDPAQCSVILPRRAYVLVLLLVTGISSLIAAVVLVFQLVAIPLNLDGASPTAERGSGVALIVLGITALYHLLRLLSDLRVLRARAAAEALPKPDLKALGAVLVTEPGAPAETTSASAPATPAPEPQPASAGPETLEDILREVAAGALDPTTAAARIRGLPSL
ncbi:MAG TPA: hypothetical protein VFU32_15375 [Ktedonobacterales bacterium]|nr:hypothetical protein [Ktedonobacterales bacterium]